MGSDDPPGKMDEKLKSENMLYSEFLRLGMQGGIDPCIQNPADVPVYKTWQNPWKGKPKPRGRLECEKSVLKLTQT